MDSVTCRLALLLVVVSRCGFGQFSGLSSTGDGASLYFVSTLRLRDSVEPRNAKVFVARAGGVSLFRAREPAPVPPDSKACSVGGFIDYVAAESASSGAVALLYRAGSAGPCSYPPFPYLTHIVAGDTESELPGVTRLSPSGRYAINFSALTSRVPTGVDVAYVDLRTNTLAKVTLPSPTFPEGIQIPSGNLRVIADDGTAIVAVGDFSSGRHGYLLRTGAEPEPFTQGLPLAIDSAAAHILMERQDGLSLLDLGSGRATLLVASDQPASGFAMSDDARRLMYLGEGQVHVLDTSTLADRTLTGDTWKISDATLSGDGKVAFAVTGQGRLLRIDVDSGTAVEWIGHTPYLSPAVLLGDCRIDRDSRRGGAIRHCARRRAAFPRVAR